MNFVIRECFLSVSEYSPILSALGTAIISFNTCSFLDAFTLTTCPSLNSSSTPSMRFPYRYSGLLKRIQPFVPRQSGEINNSKLGILRPLPPSHLLFFPSLTCKSASSPSTWRDSIERELSLSFVPSICVKSFCHFAIGSSTSR